MKNTHRTQHQIACDGIQTVWLPGTSPVRAEVERTMPKSIDGIVFSGTVRDVAVQMHRTDTLRAFGGAPRTARVQERLTDLIATMDGVRVRRPAVAHA
jgi:hypothetical protein